MESIIYTAIAVGGAAVFFNLPKRSIVPSMITGAIGYGTRFIVENYLGQKYIGIFLGIMALGFTAGYFARKQKIPTTVYFQPAIIPLVPGRALYRMMYYLVFNDYQSSAMYGLEALAVAGILAIGIYTTSAISDEIKYRIYNIKNRRSILREKNK